MAPWGQLHPRSVRRSLTPDSDYAKCKGVTGTNGSEFETRLVQNFIAKSRDFALSCSFYGVLSVGTTYNLIRDVAIGGRPTHQKTIGANFATTEADSEDRR